MSTVPLGPVIVLVQAGPFSKSIAMKAVSLLISNVLWALHS